MLSSLFGFGLKAFSNVMSSFRHRSIITVLTLTWVPTQRHIHTVINAFFHVHDQILCFFLSCALVLLFSIPLLKFSLFSVFSFPFFLFPSMLCLHLIFFWVFWLCFSHFSFFPPSNIWIDEKWAIHKDTALTSAVAKSKGSSGRPEGDLEDKGSWRHDLLCSWWETCQVLPVSASSPHAAPDCFTHTHTLLCSHTYTHTHSHARNHEHSFNCWTKRLLTDLWGPVRPLTSNGLWMVKQP